MKERLHSRLHGRGSPKARSLREHAETPRYPAVLKTFEVLKMPAARFTEASASVPVQGAWNPIPRTVPGIVFAVLLLLSGAGCTDKLVENAFHGDYSADKNNKIINEYCKSCHIHKNFEAEEHIVSVRDAYRRPFFKRTRQCRSCHYIEKDWVRNRYDRKTRYPEKANRGAYRRFEKANKEQREK